MPGAVCRLQLPATLLLPFNRSCRWCHLGKRLVPIRLALLLWHSCRHSLRIVGAPVRFDSPREAALDADSRKRPAALALLLALTCLLAFHQQAELVRSKLVSAPAKGAVGPWGKARTHLRMFLLLMDAAVGRAKHTLHVS